MIVEVFIIASVLSSPQVTCTMTSLPPITFVENPEQSCATTTYRAEFPRCKPSTATIRALNRTIERRVREAGDYDDAVVKARSHNRKGSSKCNEIAMEVSGECGLPYQVGGILSFKCRRFGGGLRSGSAPFAVNVDLEGGHIHELTMDDLVEPGAGDRLWAVVREDLKKQDVLDEAGQVEAETGTVRDSRPSFYLIRTGLVVDFGYHFSARYVDVQIPYSKLSGILKTRFVSTSTPPN